jgi:co-chaperonin GroES (HSP10)
MKAVGKYIVVKDIIKEQKVGAMDLTSSDTKHIRTQEATVVSVGNLVDGINEGDEIFYERSRAFSAVINNEKFTVIRDLEVIIVSCLASERQQ